MAKVLRCSLFFLSVALFWAGGALSGHAGQPLCGNAVREGYEECDNGAANSDPAPNACRTNCLLPSCGDGVADNGEECDDGRQSSGRFNDNRIPDYCRTDCRRAHCGDGVVDSGEACDDANTEAFDGCHQCARCYPLREGLVLSADMGPRVRLCPGRYEIKDKGAEGAVMVTAPGMDVDATGVILVAPSATAAMLGQGAVAGNAHVAASTGVSASGQKRRPSSRQEARHGTPVVHSGLSAVLRQGTGVVIAAPDVVLHGLQVEGFRTGIKVAASGVLLFNDQACRNTRDIDAAQGGNAGLRNRCSAVNGWQDQGASACSSECSD